MIRRSAQAEVVAALARQAAVVLLGPRKVGKTTLALEIAALRPSVYFDLEAPQDAAKLAAPDVIFEQHKDKLVILDEIHRAPALFSVLRGVIDAARRRGKRTGGFLLLGSASLDLIKNAGETLAGRVAFVEMTAIGAGEIDRGQAHQTRLWLRGGFPDSYLATSDAESFALRVDLIRSYLERDIPLFGPRIPAEAMRRLWTMLAHNQAQLLNASRLASAMSISSPTVARYIDLLTDLMLVRRLPPYFANVGKRLTKSPKVFIRDSGIVHALLGLKSLDDVLGHPVAGASWEGHALQSIISAAAGAEAYFYRTSAGAEIDLLLDFGGSRGAKGGLLAIEIKRTAGPKISKGFQIAVGDLRPRRAMIVHGGADRFPLSRTVEAAPLASVVSDLRGE